MVRHFPSSPRDISHCYVGERRWRCPIVVQRIVLAAIFVTLITQYGTSQIDNAEIFGIVVDRSGHKIPGAMVVLVDAERGLRRSVETNSAGFYFFVDVRPGNYMMQASASGFQTQSILDVQLFIQGTRDENFRLVADSASDTGTIQGRGTTVTSAGAVNTVVDPTLLSELPLNGRSFQTLFQLVPGVVITASSPTSQGQFSVNGQRANANYVSIDGVSANFGLAAGVNPGQSTGGSIPGLTAFGGTNSLISADDVQEFAILTSSYSAEFGRVPGAQVSIVSRSGTNKFHVNAFDYIRNDAFDANDWFSNKNRLARTPLRQNDFGLVVGGPISKDKTFFFASYEGLRLRQPTSRESDVPSVSSRNSAPLSLKPFFDAYPFPNSADEGNGLARATYAFSNPSTLNATGIRVDHQVSRSLNLFARYVISDSDRQERGAPPNSLSTVTDTRFGLNTMTVGLTKFVTPQIITDFRFNWSASSAVGRDRLDSFGGANPLLPDVILPFPFKERNSLFQFAPALGPASIELSLGRHNSSLQHQINVLGNSSWQHRTHVLKAGFDFRRLSPQVTPAAYNQTIFFADIRSALTSTTSFSAVAATVSVQSHFANYSVYIQDAWKPNARLRVTYGVRWDYNPAPTMQSRNGLKPFVLKGINDLRTVSLGQSGSPIYRAALSNFGPRVGLAYELWRAASFDTVIRAGAGTFFDLGNGPVGNASGGASFPFLSQTFLFGVAFPLSSDNAAPPLFPPKPPFSAIQAFPSVLKMPYSYHWNLALEQSLGSQQTVSVGFTGATGHSLLRTEEYLGGAAGLPPAFTQVLFTNNAGFSNYNALQVRFQRHSRKGPDVIASYTLSHSLDNVSTDTSFDGAPARFLNPRGDYGPSDFDVRHIGTVALDCNLPFGGTSPVARALLSNWFIDPIVTIRSSPPVDVVVSRDIGFGIYSLRPDLIKGVSLYIADSAEPGGRRINPAALSVSSDSRQGSLGRNFFRGFPLFQTDVAVGRRFRVSRYLNLSIRVEAFNLFNHPNFYLPASQLGRVDSSGRFVPQRGFGISQVILAQGLQAGSFNTGFSPLYQIGGTRSIQLALKAEF